MTPGTTSPCHAPSVTRPNRRVLPGSRGSHDRAFSPTSARRPGIQSLCIYLPQEKFRIRSPARADIDRDRAGPPVERAALTSFSAISAGSRRPSFNSSASRRTRRASLRGRRSEATAAAAPCCCCYRSRRADAAADAHGTPWCAEHPHATFCSMRSALGLHCARGASQLELHPGAFHSRERVKRR